MKRIATLIITFLLTAGIAGAVTLRFDGKSTYGISSAVVSAMERNASALLTEIQVASSAGRELRLSGLGLEAEASSRLTMLWKNMHFSCDDASIVGKCLNDVNGYQVRGVFVTIEPQTSSYEGETERELTISFGKDGSITGVRIALEKNADVAKIISDGVTVTDEARRREILKWVEDFRSYYNEMNLSALRQIYSNDALIITGKVVKTQKRADGITLTTGMEDMVRYSVQTKNQYLANLSRCFERNEWIKVSFDHVSVSRSGSNPDVYGVKLKQKWTSSTYSDEGWLFLLWDFHNPDAPQVHVRTWQPYNLGKDENGKNMTLPENDVFGITDFIIPSNAQ